jgi:amidase
MKITYLPCLLSFPSLLSLSIPALQLTGVLKITHARVARLGTTPRGYKPNFEFGFGAMMATSTAVMPSHAAAMSKQKPLEPSEACFDVLTTTVIDLLALLDKGELSSEEVVSSYLDQIERHNIEGMGIRALISVAPRSSVIAQARELDKERAKGQLRGGLHGVPLIIKDVFWTHQSLGMDTTCGTVALRGAKPPRNAAIVDLLVKEGAIILGKANLSELGLMKSQPPNTGGWSSAGGQTQSPYVRGGVVPGAKFLGQSTPCGSSSGSAAGVAAGFSPVGIGSETDGSIVQAATRAGLYALKPPVGTVPGDGAMPVCSAFDSHGALARTPADLSLLTRILMGKNSNIVSSKLPTRWDEEGLASFKIGFVDFDKWQPAPFVVEPVSSFTDQTVSYLLF